jgi:hypothetical protein
MIEYTVQRIADAFTTDFYIDYIWDESGWWR